MRATDALMPPSLCGFGQVLGFAFRCWDRATRALCWSDAPPDYQDKPIVTDGYATYAGFFSPDQHHQHCVIDKGGGEIGQTSLVESLNARWRQRQLGLARRSCARSEPPHWDRLGGAFLSAGRAAQPCQPGEKSKQRERGAQRARRGEAKPSEGSERKERPLSTAEGAFQNRHARCAKRCLWFRQNRSRRVRFRVSVQNNGGRRSIVTCRRRPRPSRRWFRRRNGFDLRARA